MFQHTGRHIKCHPVCCPDLEGVTPSQINPDSTALKGGVSTNKESLMNLLFICSRNQWRSPTAERVFRAYPNVQTRSAGTSPNARHTVSIRDIQWADKILVMENKHKARLQAQFARALQHKTIIVLDIADEYRYMDEALIEILQDSVLPLLAE